LLHDLQINFIGTLVVEFHHAVTIPTLDRALSGKALMIIGFIVANGVSEFDRKNWLRLLLMDSYMTTVQVCICM
jgi:hypothetical protein